MSAYRQVAAHYDEAFGRDYFRGLRVAFDILVRRHGLQFRDVLDLGCGTGLFACYLARRYGARVLGVDRSAAMLAVARRNCPDCRVGFLRMDIRALELPYRFDLVTANFDTFNHLTGRGELQEVMKRVARVLRPGGHLLFDSLTPAAAGRLSEQPRTRLVMRRAVRQRIRVVDGGRGIVTMVSVKQGMFRGSEAYRERLYSIREVAHWAREAGLAPVAVWDAETLCIASTASARVLMLARMTQAKQRLRTRIPKRSCCRGNTNFYSSGAAPSVGPLPADRRTASSADA